MTATPMPLEVPRPAWKAEALQAIEARARTGQAFTSDDLRADGLPEPPHHNMWGPVFASARRLGVIHKIGHTESTKPSRSRGVHAVWVGSTFEQQIAA